MAEHPVAQQIRDMNIRHHAELEVALKHYKTREARDQCRHAYEQLRYAAEDVIAQKGGLPGSLYKEQP